MDVFRTDRIRNVVLLGHGGAGKTTLAEAMAYLAGMTNRLGRVEDGNTVSDYDKEEIKRHFSITTSLIPVPWDKMKVNVLDTPGYFDFVGEVEEAVSAADAAIIVVSGKAGVQVGTQKAWNLCEKYKLPRMIFVTDMDVDDVSYREVVEELTELYGKRIAPLHFPIREDGKFVGYVNVVKQAGRRYIDKAGKEECPVPDYLTEYLEKYHETLMESVAETSEEFMDRYFEGDTFSVAEVSAAIATNVQDGSIVPVCMGSPVNLRGVSNLLDDICGYFPSPSGRSCNGIAQKPNEIFEANYDFAKAKSAYVFKTIADPFLGKYSLIKVCSGVLKSDDTLLNVEKGTEERVNKLYVLEGSKPIEVPELFAGDIGAIAKLGSVQTGDSLATKANPILYPKAVLSTPYTYKRFKAVKKGDEDKISGGIAKLLEEDLTLRYEVNKETKQMCLYGLGDMHLDIVTGRLKSRYGVSVTLTEAKVPYRETIKKSAQVEGKHKKQSGGHGQYGHVKIEFSPGEQEGLEFTETIFGGSVPKNFHPAVEKGLQESMQKGILAGYPVINIKANLFDGSYHPVDSSEMSFKLAANLAFKEGMKQCNPVLLEPIGTLKVTVPDSLMGDIIGDLNKRRGRILGTDQAEKKGCTVVEAEVPQAEMGSYAIQLRAMTQGRGVYTYEFTRYEEAPANVAQKVIEEAKKAGDNE